MPRGVKGSVDYDSKILAVDERIEKYSKKLSDFKSQREELIRKKEEAEMQGLYDFISANNLTVQDVIDKISPSPQSINT